MRSPSAAVMSPTWPSSGSFCRAVRMAPSLPETPAAFTPRPRRAMTTCLFIWAERTISATAMAVSSVTR